MLAAPVLAVPAMGGLGGMFNFVIVGSVDVETVA
jgi:hypothetical protein